MSRRLRILLAEDEALIATLLRRNLELGGRYEVAPPVATGQAAIEAAARIRPDVVLMDVRLAGEMTGIEAARRIIADLEIPVVLMTGYSDQELMRRTEGTLAIPHLTKPITPADIDPVLDSLFDPESRRKETP